MRRITKVAYRSFALEITAQMRRSEQRKVRRSERRAPARLSTAQKFSVKLNLCVTRT